MTTEITVVISCYNKERYISDAISSVLRQTSRRWQLIVIDDCSTDSSFEKIKQFENTEQVQIYRSPENRGANYCRNKGIEVCSSAFIMFLDGDDLLDDTCIERRLKCAEKFKDDNMIVFTMGVFQNVVGDTSSIWNPVVKDPLRCLLSHELNWSIVQPLWKTEFIRSLGGFDLAFKRLQDVELNTRALLNNNVKVQMVHSAPDCYYRTNLERLNYDIVEFLDRWTQSAIQYAKKFYGLVPKEYKRYLILTLFQTHLQIIFFYRNNAIVKKEFSRLINEITNFTQEFEVVEWKRFLFRVAVLVNSRARIPGFNKFLKLLLTI